MQSADWIVSDPKRNEEFGVECKTDFYCFENPELAKGKKASGRVAVEHKALLHSKSGIWVYQVAGHPYALQLSRAYLELLLTENYQKYKRWPVLRMGQYRGWGTLIPFQDFEEISTPLFEIN